MSLYEWLNEAGYVAGKWRISIRDNGNEFTGPKLQYTVFGDGKALTFEDK